VPRSGRAFTEADAARLARAATRRHGIGAELEPLRVGANHVFRAGDAVVRVAPATADVAGQIRLARWLIAEGARRRRPRGAATRGGRAGRLAAATAP
jgi:hypothetical protein